MKVEYREVGQGSPPYIEDGRRFLIYIDDGEIGCVRLADFAKKMQKIYYRFYGFANIGGETREFQVDGFDVERKEPEDVIAEIVARINLFEMFRGGKQPIAILKRLPDEI